MPHGEIDVRATLDAVLHNIETGPDIGFIGTNIGLLTRATIGLNDKVDRGFAQVDQRFDKVDVRMGIMGDDIRKMSARIEQIFGLIVKDELKGKKK